MPAYTPSDVYLKGARGFFRLGTRSRACGHTPCILASELYASRLIDSCRSISTRYLFWDMRKYLINILNCAPARRRALRGKNRTLAATGRVGGGGGVATRVRYIITWGLYPKKKIHFRTHTHTSRAGVFQCTRVYVYARMCNRSSFSTNTASNAIDKREKGKK